MHADIQQGKLIPLFKQIFKLEVTTLKRQQTDIIITLKKKINKQNKVVQ